MIKKEDILHATNGGLDIILSVYPQARECVDNPKKHFAARNERTPSASLRQYNSDKYGRIWQVTDFGGEGRGEDGVSVYLRENGFDKSRYYEGLLRLASIYGVTDELKKEVNKPTIEQRTARTDEADGSRSFELNDKFTDFELQVWGPKVTQEHLEALHWHSVKWISNVKDRKVTTKHSNEHYPIFMRECIVREAMGDKEEEKFYKIYEPFNCDKGFRFSYFPAGKKPQHYINGLAELKKRWKQYNEEEEKKFSESESGGAYKEKKLPEAVICSGERDSICCRSMGFMPLWFNSETYRLSVEEYREIMRYVDTLYNIPDLDETGRRKGRELSLRFIDIFTVWLPSWLSTYRDNRGKSRKDLRDWMELRPERKDLCNLLKVAMPAKFWTSYQTKEGKTKYEINSTYLFNFLELNGFHILKDDNSDTPQFIHVDGNKVKRTTAKAIKEFIIQWLSDRYEDIDVRNLVINSMKISNAALESLGSIDLDFTAYTQDSQLFFFDNATVKVSRASAAHDGWSIMKPGDEQLKNYVWEENVIKHKFKKLAPMFEVSETSKDGEKEFDITVTDTASPFFGYLINSSRVHWRKEMETRFADDADGKAAYASANKFRIDGEGLTDEEICQQKQNLLSKIFCFGYMLHRYKSVSRAWAPMAMDSKIGLDGECNGRSGKSFYFSALALLKKTVKLSGRNPKLMDNPHVFDQVNQHTQLMLVDDCDRYLNMGLFYDNITSDMTVNPKNNKSFTIPFEDSPKLAFTTNYIPSDFSPSTEARSLYLVFSDYYHQKAETNDYLETRSIRDDFDKDLLRGSYAEEDWNADLNFFLQCCHFYLQHCDDGTKIQPPMGNIVVRKKKADMGENFEEWANGYFSLYSERLDEYLVREEVKEAYVKYSNVQKVTMNSFNKKLKAFVDLCPWIESLNPIEVCGVSGRIQRSVEVAPGKSVIKDMIYLKKANEDIIRELEAKNLEKYENSDEPF